MQWTGEPFKPLVPPSLFPFAALVLLVLGFIGVAGFSFSSKSVTKEFPLAVVASILLGFGSVFLFQASGVYL
ncbi:hypothetical protein K7432_006961 [Basidiobolus ranarum]